RVRAVGRVPVVVVDVPGAHVLDRDVHALAVVTGEQHAVVEPHRIPGPAVVVVQRCRVAEGREFHTLVGDGDLDAASRVRVVAGGEDAVGRPRHLGLRARTRRPGDLCVLPGG